MKKSFVLLVLSVLHFCVFAQTEKEPYLVKSLSGDAISEVEAKTSGGSISVTGGAASNARIEMYVTPGNNKSLSKEEIKQRLEELYDVNIDVANHKLTATARSKDKIKDWKKSLSIAFKIYVPQNVATNLSTSGGSISLSDLAGTQTFSTSGGSLHISKLTGKIDGRTSGGSIYLEDSKDDIVLRTSGGSIKAANCDGRIKLSTSGGSLDLNGLKGTIEASTSGGSVRAENVSGELKAHTSGGSVHMTDLACSLDASTSGGNIDVAFTQLGSYVKLANSSGNVSLALPKNKGLDLDLSGDIANTSFANFSGKVDRQMVKGKLNGGGVPVTVDASSGHIKLEMR